MTLILIVISLVLSLGFNFLLLWYTRRLLTQTWDILTDKEAASGELKHYSDHLKSIYEMEMFYGDETLQGLIDHTRHIRERLDIYANLFSELEGGKINEDNDNDDGDADTKGNEAEEETTEAGNG